MDFVLLRTPELRSKLNLVPKCPLDARKNNLDGLSLKSNTRLRLIVAKTAEAAGVQVDFHWSFGELYCLVGWIFRRECGQMNPVDPEHK